MYLLGSVQLRSYNSIILSGPIPVLVFVFLIISTKGQSSWFCASNFYVEAIFDWSSITSHNSIVSIVMQYTYLLEIKRELSTIREGFFFLANKLQ